MANNDFYVRREQFNTMPMNAGDEVRASIIRDTTLPLIHLEHDPFKNLESNERAYLNKNYSWNKMNNKTWISKAYKTASILYKLSQVNGLLSGSYSIENSTFSYRLNKEFFVESALKQLSHHKRLVPALACFDDIMKNLRVYDVTSDIYKGTKKEIKKLSKIYHMISCFEYSGLIYPVDIMVHQSKTGTMMLKLMYVGEGIDIKKEAARRGIDTVSSGADASYIILPELLQNVNKKDGMILKHIPDVFLSPDNRIAKKYVLAYDKAKLFSLREYSNGNSISQRDKDKLQKYFLNGGSENNALNFLKNKDIEYDMPLFNNLFERGLKMDKPKLTYYVAESMEFSGMGEYHNNLTLEQAIDFYNKIPDDRLNGGKGIGFSLDDGSMYSGEFPILDFGKINVDIINDIAYYRDNYDVQKAIHDLIVAMDGKITVNHPERLNYTEKITPVYFPINEGTARSAKMANSFNDYIAGSATAAYESDVNKAYELASKVIEAKPERREEALKLAESYSKRLATWTNTYYSIEASVPSIMISGAGNFPVHKKEKQNARRDKHYALLKDYVNKPLDQLDNLIYSSEIIKSGDANAITLLKEKVDELQKHQDHMKALNAYYKKNHTVKGFDGITDDQAIKIDKAISETFEKRPFASYELSNNRQNLRSTQDRLARLEKEKAKEPTIKENRFFKILENNEIMRLQLFFDSKPDNDTRDVLKSNGFIWSGKNGAWQRQLTNNARYAVDKVISSLDKLFPETKITKKDLDVPREQHLSGSENINLDSLVYQLENKNYLEIHTTDGGYDYTFYNDNFVLLDGGVIESDQMMYEVVEDLIADEYGNIGFSVVDIEITENILPVSIYQITDMSIHPDGIHSSINILFSFNHDALKDFNIKEDDIQNINHFETVYNPESDQFSLYLIYNDDSRVLIFLNNETKDYKDKILDSMEVYSKAYRTPFHIDGVEGNYLNEEWKAYKAEVENWNIRASVPNSYENKLHYIFEYENKNNIPDPDKLTRLNPNYPGVELIVSAVRDNGLGYLQGVSEGEINMRYSSLIQNPDIILTDLYNNALKNGAHDMFFVDASNPQNYLQLVSTKYNTNSNIHYEGFFYQNNKLSSYTDTYISANGTQPDFPELKSFINSSLSGLNYPYLITDFMVMSDVLTKNSMEFQNRPSKEDMQAVKQFSLNEPVFNEHNESFSYENPLSYEDIADKYFDFSQSDPKLLLVRELNDGSEKQYIYTLNEFIVEKMHISKEQMDTVGYIGSELDIKYPRESWAKVNDISGSRDYHIAFCQDSADLKDFLSGRYYDNSYETYNSLDNNSKGANEYIKTEFPSINLDNYNNHVFDRILFDDTPANIEVDSVMKNLIDTALQNGSHDIFVVNPEFPQNYLCLSAVYNPTMNFIACDAFKVQDNKLVFSTDIYSWLINESPINSDFSSWVNKELMDINNPVMLTKQDNLHKLINDKGFLYNNKALYINPDSNMLLSELYINAHYSGADVFVVTDLENPQNYVQFSAEQIYSQGIIRYDAIKMQDSKLVSMTETYSVPLEDKPVIPEFTSWIDGAIADINNPVIIGKMDYFIDLIKQKGYEYNYTPSNEEIEALKNVADQDISIEKASDDNISMPSYFADGRFYINAPYADRKTVRELGGDWDSKEKKWYFVNPQDKPLFDKWLTDEQKAEPIPSSYVMSDPVDNSSKEETNEDVMKGIPGSADPENKLDKTKQILSQLEEGTKDVYSSEKYTNYLNTMSRMPSYSFNNTMLIYLANPDASFVTTFNKMRDEFGYQVQAQQKGITILRPNKYSKSPEAAMKEIDRYIASNGEARIGQYHFTRNEETGNFDIYRGWNKAGDNLLSNINRKQLKAFLESHVINKEFAFPPFLPYTVFDISQARPIVHRDENGIETIDPRAESLQLSLSGSVKDHDISEVARLFEATGRITNLPVKFDPPIGNEKGYFSHDGYINITPSNTPTHALKTLIHETAHSRLHADSSLGLGRTQKEVEAESVAYVVCKYYNIDTSDYSFGYVAQWSHDKDLKTLQASLATIQKEAYQIISEIDQKLEEVKDIDLSKDSQYLDNPIFKSFLSETIIKAETTKGDDIPVPENNINNFPMDGSAGNALDTNEIIGYYMAEFKGGNINVIQVTESEGKLVIITKNDEGTHLHDFTERRYDSLIKDGYKRILNINELPVDVGLIKKEELENQLKDESPIKIEITAENANLVHIVEKEDQFYIMVNMDGQMIPYDNVAYDDAISAQKAIPNFDIIRKEYSENMKKLLDEMNAGESAKNVIVDIYQVKDEMIHEYAFNDYDFLVNTMKKAVDIGNYDLVASMSFNEIKDIKKLPDMLYYISNTSGELNNYKVEGMNLRTLSVSDMIVIGSEKEVNAFYIDDIGFKRIDDFIPSDKSLPVCEFTRNYNINPVAAIIKADNLITVDQATIISGINREVLPLPSHEGEVQKYLEDGIKMADDIINASKYMSVQIVSSDVSLFRPGEVMSFKDANKKITALEKELSKAGTAPDAIHDIMNVRINVFIKEFNKETSVPIVYDAVIKLNAGEQKTLLEFMQRDVSNNLSGYREAQASGYIDGRVMKAGEAEKVARQIENLNLLKSVLDKASKEKFLPDQRPIDINVQKKLKEIHQEVGKEKESKSKVCIEK